MGHRRPGHLQPHQPRAHLPRRELRRCRRVRCVRLDLRRLPRRVRDGRRERRRGVRGRVQRHETGPLAPCAACRLGNGARRRARDRPALHVRRVGPRRTDRRSPARVRARAPCPAAPGAVAHRLLRRQPPPGSGGERPRLGRLPAERPGAGPDVRAQLGRVAGRCVGCRRPGRRAPGDGAAARGAAPAPRSTVDGRAPSPRPALLQRVPGPVRLEPGRAAGPRAVGRARRGRRAPWRPGPLRSDPGAAPLHALRADPDLRAHRGGCSRALGSSGRGGVERPGDDRPALRPLGDGLAQLGR